MTAAGAYTVNITHSFHEVNLQKGLWIALVNATRTPPHVGLVFDGKYSSLNITGQELDINVLALVKRIEMQKIKAVFIRLKPHPVFSIDYLHGHFKIQVERYERVIAGTATCFTPVKTFFAENYALHEHQLEYLYNLFPELYEEEVISGAFALNMNELERSTFHLPVYTMKDIEDKLNNLSA